MNDVETVECRDLLDAYVAALGDKSWIYRMNVDKKAVEASQRNRLGELEGCLRYSRAAHHVPRVPGEPARTYDERLADTRADDESTARAEATTLAELRAATPPDVRRRASSAALCRYAAWRSQLIAIVNREHRYAAETGVQNLTLLQRVKVQLEAVDAGAEHLRGLFAAKKIQPESCSVPAVAALQRCVWLQAGGGLQPIWNMPRDQGVDCSNSEVTPYLAYLGQ